MGNSKQKAIIDFRDSKSFSLLSSLLAEYRKVKVKGLGIFEVRTIRAREAYNVANGKRFQMKAYNKIVFRPTQRFKDIIK